MIAARILAVLIASIGLFSAGATLGWTRYRREGFAPGARSYFVGAFFFAVGWGICFRGMGEPILASLWSLYIVGLGYLVVARQNEAGWPFRRPCTPAPLASGGRMVLGFTTPLIFDENGRLRDDLRTDDERAHDLFGRPWNPAYAGEAVDSASGWTPVETFSQAEVDHLADSIMQRRNALLYRMRRQKGG